MRLSTDIWLVVDSKKYGGIEAHILNLALLLKNQGTDVCVVFVNDHGDHPLSAYLDERGIKIFKCHSGFVSVLRLAKKHCPQVMHSHGYKAGVITRLVGRLLHIPVVHTHHAGEKHKGKLALYMALDRWSAFLNQKNISVSRLIRKSLPCDSEVVNNFVSMPENRVCNGGHIAFVGRLSDEKGPLDFLSLARCFVNEEFHLYGDGPMSKDLQSKAGDNCTFHGHVEMKHYWSNIDVLIISSKYEGLPLSALEAMAHGVPVIAYRVGGLPSLISNEEDGFLTVNNTLISLAGRLVQWLFLDSKKKNVIRERAKARIGRDYSIESLTGRYCRIYSDVCPNVFRHKNAKRVLIAHYGDQWIRGSEVCLLELCKNINRNRWEPIVWTNVTCLEQELKLLDVTTIRGDFTMLAGWGSTKWNFLNYMCLRNNAKNIIESYQVDLVHCNNAAPNQWLVPVAKMLGVPILCQLHSGYQFRDRMSLLINEVDSLVGVSKAVLSPLRSDVFKNANQQVVFNGIDLDTQLTQSVSLREKLNIPSGSPVLITVGSLIRRKGVDIILESMQYLNKHVHLVVVGKGDQEDELVQLSDNIGVSQRVHWLGERDDVSGLLRGGANVFVSGAREEAFGLVLAEAGLAKVPVVAPKVGGVSEVLKNGAHGILVNPDDPKSLAVGINQALEEGEGILEMTERFYTFIYNNFDSKKNAHRFMGIYDDLRERDTPKNHFFVIRLIVKILIELLLKRRKMVAGVGP